MNWQLVCWVIAAIMMAIASVWSPPTKTGKPTLTTLAWAFFIAGFAFSISG
jgi:hypothetical protein